MTPVGAIHIELFHHAGKASGVRVNSTRPDATRALLGKTPEQLLATVPLLFSLCGNAQSFAALLACRTALGLADEPEADAARCLLVQVETLREHAWRILLDWPGLLGLQPNKPAVAALLKICAQFKPCLFDDGEAFRLDSRVNINSERLAGLTGELMALIDTAVFNGGLSDFRLLETEAQLKDWLALHDGLPVALLNALYRQNWLALGQNQMACLPVLDSETLSLQQQDWSAFCREPQWQGLCYESTPLNRRQSHPLIVDLQNRYGNGLLTRLVAMLLEAAEQLTQSVETVSTGDDEGFGLAQIQAARGLLIHKLELREGRVYDYRVVAPTEWNFHPEGVVAQGLIGLQAADADSLQQQAEWLVNAVDPCVAYRLTLVDNLCHET